MGPFFNDVANWLETLEREAVNVVFNGGDRFYCRNRHYLTYTQTPKEFPAWLKETWKDYPFDTIFASATAVHCTGGARLG
jgi:capsular polysaccharide export protein